MARALTVLMVLVVCGCWHVSPIDSDTDGNIDSDDGANADACAASENWYDAATGLCWQNPTPDFYNWEDSVVYCNNLSLAGFDDWRLPMIQELISLMRGCVDGTSTGDLSTCECGLSDPECLDFECGNPGCGYCSYLEGPDDNPAGCYWVPEFDGMCVTFWSSSSAEDENSAWFVPFTTGLVNITGKHNLFFVRCVRGGL